MKKPKETLCWRCKHAVPNYSRTKGCYWSVWFLPVPGWDATPTILKAGNGEKSKDREIASYFVHRCPKFGRG